MPYLLAVVLVLRCALYYASKKAKDQEHYVSLLQSVLSENEFLRAKAQDLEQHAVEEDWIVSALTNHQPDWLWTKGYLLTPNDVDQKDVETPSYIMCDGSLIEVGTLIGAEDFREVYERALRDGIYNCVNLEEGGWQLILTDRLRQKGFSKASAESRVLEFLSQDSGQLLSAILENRQYRTGSRGRAKASYATRKSSADS
jgi:hypothetical protein